MDATLNLKIMDATVKIAFQRYNIPIGDIRSIHMLGTEDAQGFEIILDY